MTRVTPNQPKTPLRSFRVPDDLWMPARDKAHREGITITDVLQRALREYLGADTQTPPTPKVDGDRVGGEREQVLGGHGLIFRTYAQALSSGCGMSDKYSSPD